MDARFDRVEDRLSRVEEGLSRVERNLHDHIARHAG
jgi:hypothetical protein